MLWNLRTAYIHNLRKFIQQIIPSPIGYEDTDATLPDVESCAPSVRPAVPPGYNPAPVCTQTAPVPSCSDIAASFAFLPSIYRYTLKGARSCCSLSSGSLTPSFPALPRSPRTDTFAPKKSADIRPSYTRTSDAPRCPSFRQYAA